MSGIQRIFDLAESPFVIAEVAQSHDGSLGLAHAFIDVAAAAGAHAIKYQTHIASEESSSEEPWRLRFSRQDETRYGYWQRMEFSPEQWAGLKRHAEEKSLVFLSSPFSRAAVQLLERLEIAAWKIASGEVSNPFLMEPVLATLKPVLLSSGMSDFQELDQAVANIKAAQVPLAVMQCTTAYPCPPERVGLNVMQALAQRYQVPVGLSDHSGTIYPSLAAACMGARVIEVHLTLSREMFGPDVPASVTGDELAKLTQGLVWMHTMSTHPVDKDEMSRELGGLRRTFGRSLVLAKDLAEGDSLTRDDLTDRKPGTGIPVSAWREVMGRKLKVALKRGDFLKPEHFE